jgi:hypothetical protein
MLCLLYHNSTCMDIPPSLIPSRIIRHYFDGEEELGYTVKKRLGILPSPAGMSLTKLSQAGIN